jgi:hypothetical protein
MTKEEIRALKLFSAIFSDFKQKISDENEKRVLKCLKQNLEDNLETLKILLAEKEAVASQILSNKMESDQIVFESIWALNITRKNILQKNLDFVNSKQNYV